MDSLLACLWKVCSSDRPYETSATLPGLFNVDPEYSCRLVVPGPEVVSAVTGPDIGVTELQQTEQQGVAVIPWQHAGLGSQQQQQQSQQLQAQQLPLQEPTQHCQHDAQQQGPQGAVKQPWLQQACGNAVSLYDVDPLTRLRHGDPIADCFGAVTYSNGAVLALADGVNWGNRPKLAARAAVMAFVAHVHKVLQQLHAKGQQTWSSSEAFEAMRGAVRAAQQFIKASDGSLTTLVAAVVAPQKWGPGHSLLTVLIGDSPAYVWRAQPARVDEISYTPPLHGLPRDPRICPGCLGFAIGEEPDLSNVTFSITRLEEGDLVFLTSDGISDNFDPIVRKQARPATGLPGQTPSSGYKLPAMSHASCHAAALLDMGHVLRNACLEAAHKQQQRSSSASGQAAADQAFPLAAVSSSFGNGQKAPGDVPSEKPAASAAVASVEPAAGTLSCSVVGNSPAGNNSSTTSNGGVVRGSELTPGALVDALLTFVYKVTGSQRQMLEDPGRGPVTEEFSDAVADLPGKLDHACVVAYRVGPSRGYKVEG